MAMGLQLRAWLPLQVNVLQLHQRFSWPHVRAPRRTFSPSVRVLVFVERACEHPVVGSPLTCPGGNWTWVTWEAQGLYRIVSRWEGAVAVGDEAWTCRTF